MAEFVFPKIKPHCVTVNGYNLVFTPGATTPIQMSNAAFDLVQNCSGLTIGQSREWLQERYGEAPARTARDLAEIVDLGYFREPQPGDEDCKVNLPPPTIFGICITHKCDMRCSYCFARKLRGTDQPEDITPETARAAIDYLFDVLQPPWADISLGITGEPQLRWDMIRDVTDYARKKSEESEIGVRFHITTNGLQVIPEMLEDFRNHNDMGITLSWDGPPEIHNRQRLSVDGADTYDRVSNAFRILQTAVQDRPRVAATVTAANPDVAGVFAHLFDSGVRDLTLKLPRSVGAIAVTEESLSSFKASYAELAELLLTTDRFQMERLFTVTKDDFLGCFLYRIAESQRVLYRCGGGRCVYDVDTNGDIYPCASLVGVEAFKMGNVRTGIDENARAFFLKDTSLPRIERCQDCWAKYYCGGPCTYVSALTCGHFDIPYGPDCEMKKYLVELAGYIIAKLNSQRPGLLEHVFALRRPVPEGIHPKATCCRAPKGDMWKLPAEAWQMQDPIVLTRREHAGGYRQWRRTSDCSAMIHLKWNETFLYLMAEVSDDSFGPPETSEGEWWYKDSIQFALDPENNGGYNLYPWKLPEGDYEYGVACVDGQTYLYDCQVDPIRPSGSGKAVVTREDNTTTYRVAIPWKQISEFTPSVGAECRFSIVVNGCDGNVRRWLQWTHGLAIRKAPARFGVLRLVE